MFSNQEGTIIAPATGSGPAAIAVLRLSGPNAIAITNSVFSGKNLGQQPSHSVHFGRIVDGDTVLDEVLATLFRAPRSYTGEEVVEISCHGSAWIRQRIMDLLIRQGAKAAQPGEFTLRAFLNGKLDLSQAEAVADLIASDSAASHKMAMNQMRGGFSKEISRLREQLMNFASLIELELDFSEEDVEFADRTQLNALVHRVQQVCSHLIDSFRVGNVMKNGVPVTIAGKPNAGKSTLLNALLNEDKAIVSNIAGTTRDAIEDEMVLDGIRFRFIDTAGIRETTDTIEAIGVERSLTKMREASIVIYLYDLTEETPEEAIASFSNYEKDLDQSDARVLMVANKADLKPEVSIPEDHLLLSSKSGSGLEQLTSALTHLVLSGQTNDSDVVVSNSRHLQALSEANEALDRAYSGLQSGVTSDFIAMDIRQALHHLGEITGEITTDDLLGNIFSKFCIGK